MTVVSDYRALLSNLSWTDQSGAAITLTYSFSTAATPYLQGSNAAAAATFHALTEDEKATVRTALAAWSSVSGVTFQEASHTVGDLTFGMYDLTTVSGSSGEAGLGNYPSTATYIDANGVPRIYSNFLSQGGDVYFDNSYQTNPAFFSDFAHVAIHEIGHTLGLKHPFDSVSMGSGYTLDTSLDNGTETVMSYTGARMSTLGPLDIQAIQSIYGTKQGASHPFTEVWNAATESLTVTGNATLAESLYGSGGNDVFYSLGPHDALSGGEGDDLFYLSGKPAGVNGGSGTDTVVTGLIYSASGTPVGSSGETTRYVAVAAYNDFQTYVNIAYLDFENGIYTTAANSFASYDSVASPGTTNPDLYSWNAAAGGTWGTGTWFDLSSTLTLLPPGANDAAGIVGSASPSAPATIGGIGNAASLALGGYANVAGTFVLGSLAVSAGGLMVASGGRVTATGTASVVQAAGLAGLTVAAGGVARVDALVLASGGGLQYALGGGTATVAAAGTLEVGTAGTAVAGSVTIDAGRVLSGLGSVGSAVVNNGTVLASGGQLGVTRGLSGAGSLQIAASGTLIVAGALPQAVAFTGVGGTLDLLNPTSTGVQAGVISGFAAGDTIEMLSGGTATGANWNPNTGVLSLSNAGGLVAQMQLAGNYGASLFQVSTKAGGYADVTVTAPDPLFDASYYLAQNPDVAAAGIDPYQHYLAHGWREGRTPDAWFDGNYYLKQNPDVAAAGINPLLHFEQYGWKELRQPSLLFDDAKYLSANPDVRAAGLDPLQHYVSFGQVEGRASFPTGGSAAADPLVNAAYYDQQLGATLMPAATAGAQQAAWGYDNGGWQKGLSPDALFDTAYYLSHNRDVAAAHVDPLLHYETFGWKEGRDPSAQFSTSKYLTAYADVRAAGLDPLLHYVVYGQGEGRTAFSA